MIQPNSALTLVAICCTGSWVATVTAEDSEREFLREVSPFFREYCTDCHGNDGAQAQVNIEELTAAPSYETRFRTWEQLATMVRENRMPPKDMPQPSNEQRLKLASRIASQLDQIANSRAGDPGRVVMRRLTNAEYTYTIQDLTGLDLSLETTLTGDAVGGAGFANAGDAQFVQDSTLERYLVAARLVAAHAVVGSGPLQFFHDPGATGLELSAIHRIQEIYRRHGFRTSAGEGGEPFGLQLYPRALFVAWRFLHRQKLGIAECSLVELAAEEQLDARFARHIWTVLNDRSPSFPISELVAAWQKLPVPTSLDEQFERHVRQDCHKLASLLQSWRRRLTRDRGDKEEAALLTAGAIRLTPKSSFQANIDWTEGSGPASLEFIVASATGAGIEDSLTIWRNPTIQFRRSDGSRSKSIPLAKLLTRESKNRALLRPLDRASQTGEADLVIAGDATVELEFEVPDGAVGARLAVEAELQTDLSPASIVRCTVRNGSDQGDPAADTGEISAILGASQGAAFETWKARVLEFAKVLPDISHREPAPSDRDPIPAPFDNSYNSSERNEFHYTIKYHRDDDFLVTHILDDLTRERLDQAWNDLLSSFDYYATYVAFVAEKCRHDLNGQTIASLRPEWIVKLPDESRDLVRCLVKDYHDVQAAIRDAQPGHVQDALQFAKSAWRRPLTVDEQNRLRDFYAEMREKQKLPHADAVRALLTRILVAPAFLYRVENPHRQSGVLRLSRWELASRLSYFLWASPPDQELLQAVENGELQSDTGLLLQTRRMLRDPKARRFVTEFFGQWFGFYRFDSYRGIDAERFPEFDDRLKSSMHEEAVSFFEYIVREDRPVGEILFADYTYLNQDLARHYKIPLAGIPKQTSQTQFVTGVDQFHRGGLLGLGAVHAATSAPRRTSAVRRGDWILRRVLGTPVPPPPADAGSLPADDVLPDEKTARERLIAHRREAACVNCHSRMDPLGFAMENFDPIGRWRSSYRDGRPVDATGTLNDGTHIDGFDSLQQYLRTQQSKFHRTLCSKLLGYALGRGEVLSDKLLLQQMMADLKENGRFSMLVGRIVTSRQFRTRRGYDGQPTTIHNGPASRTKERTDGDR